jgi:hypothetical protein
VLPNKPPSRRSAVISALGQVRTPALHPKAGETLHLSPRYIVPDSGVAGPELAGALRNQDATLTHGQADLPWLRAAKKRRRAEYFFRIVVEADSAGIEGLDNTLIGCFFSGYTGGVEFRIFCAPGRERLLEHVRRHRRSLVAEPAIPANANDFHCDGTPRHSVTVTKHLSPNRTKPAPTPAEVATLHRRGGRQVATFRRSNKRPD